MQRQGKAERELWRDRAAGTDIEVGIYAQNLGYLYGEGSAGFCDGDFLPFKHNPVYVLRYILAGYLQVKGFKHLIERSQFRGDDCLVSRALGPRDSGGISFRILLAGREKENVALCKAAAVEAGKIYGESLRRGLADVLHHVF